ncbi:DUF453 domain protein [Hyaloscypha finlandica]|nr:DUF453 domain protein [Hyaloscypha finlandica]
MAQSLSRTTSGDWWELRTESPSASYYRGVTPRAIIFREEHLPADRAAWSPIFYGMGGGISSLSKVCVVGPFTVAGADVDYTFAAIGVKNLDIDRKEGMATVKIHNTNLGKIIYSTFPVVDGEAARVEVLGIVGTILPEGVDAHPTFHKTLASIRRKVAVAVGICKDEASTPDVYQPHRAVPITVALATAAAANLKSSTVHANVSSERVDPNRITSGHSSGKIMVGTKLDDRGSLTHATVFRTARRRMAGFVNWKRGGLTV